MKSQIATCAVLAASLAVWGCGRNEEKVVASETPAGTATSSASEASANEAALVRIIHAIPDTNSIDVLADESPVASNIAYGTATPYREVPANVDDFAIRPSGEPAATPLAENSEGVMAGRHYTLVAFPGRENGKPEIQVLTDSHEQPDSNRARVRLINASADLDALDVFVAGRNEAWLDDVAFREASDYQEIEGTAKEIEIRAADGKRVVAKPDVRIEPGKSYTIVVTGKADGSPRLNALVIEDQVLGTAPAPQPTN
ncbi:MAG TPA: DUF4397 domain-containing protein [Vicinamibacterales bacterium]